MSGRARATRSRARHGRSSPAVDGGSVPRGRGESPPPVADVTARGTSPASTIGVASATPAPARASPRRSVARQSTEGVQKEQVGKKINKEAMCDFCEILSNNN